MPAKEICRKTGVTGHDFTDLSANMSALGGGPSIPEPGQGDTTLRT